MPKGFWLPSLVLECSRSYCFYIIPSVSCLKKKRSNVLIFLDSKTTLVTH